MKTSTRSARTTAAAALAALTCLAAPRPAAANGRYPAANQIVPPSASRANPDLAAVRTTFGVLLSQDASPDAGGTWRWLCESALGVPAVSVEDPAIGLTAADALVVGLVEGLEVSADTGCNFACTGGSLAGTPVIDVVVRPDSPHVVLALTSAYVLGDAGPGDAGPTMTTRVVESSDDGATWAVIGTPIDPSVIVTTIEVAASDPQRIYVSGTRGFGTSRTASLFVSGDHGATWTERPVPLDPMAEVSIYIGAVDPLVADRVYVRSSGQSATRLFVTGDAGVSFTEPLTLTGPMLGFALSPDGSKVYAGGQEDGLFVGTSGDAGLAFRKTSSIPIQCLATQGPDLWACSDDQPGRFVAGLSTDDGATFSARLHMTGIASAVACTAAPPGATLACGADANASQCGGATFSALCGNLGGCATDAGPADAGALADGGEAVNAVSFPASSAACRCSAARGGGVTAAAFAALVAALLAGRRRRTMRRD